MSIKTVREFNNLTMTKKRDGNGAKVVSKKLTDASKRLNQEMIEQYLKEKSREVQS